MAESMKGLKRTHHCGELSAANEGETVTVMGWVQKQRNKGGIIFVDLRDCAGILQVIFEESDCGADNFAKAEKLRSEYVAAVVGKVEKRAGAVNGHLATGEIEVRATEVRILSEAETPPFKAMNRFGSDKPDTRFGMELTDVSEVVAGCGFGVFTSALENGGSVRGINVKGQADGSYKSSFAKFMTKEELKTLVEAMDGQPGDLLLFAADKLKIVCSVLGALRCEIAKQLEMIDNDRFDFLWVMEFPLPDLLCCL